jgi:hypothetical protein
MISSARHSFFAAIFSCQKGRFHRLDFLLNLSFSTLRCSFSAQFLFESVELADLRMPRSDKASHTITPSKMPLNTHPKKLRSFQNYTLLRAGNCFAFEIFSVHCH